MSLLRWLFLHEQCDVILNYICTTTLHICVVLIGIVIAIECFLSIVSFVASLDLFSLVRNYNRSLTILSESFLVLVLCALSVANAVWLFFQVRGLWTRHLVMLIQFLHAVPSFLLLTQSLLQGMLSLPLSFGLPLPFSRPLLSLSPSPFSSPSPSPFSSPSLTIDTFPLLLLPFPPPLPLSLTIATSPLLLSFPLYVHMHVSITYTNPLVYSAGLYLYVSCATREMPTREKVKHLRSQLNLNYMFLVYNITTNVAIAYYGQSIFKIPSLSYMTGEAAYRLYSIFRLRYLVAYRAFSIVRLRRLIAYGGQRLRYLRQAAEAPREVAYEKEPFLSGVQEKRRDHTNESFRSGKDKPLPPLDVRSRWVYK